MTIQRKICTILLSAASMMFAFGFVQPTPSSGATLANAHWYSPIFSLGSSARSFFTCVIWRESRSTWRAPKTHDGDSAYPGQYGIFQFEWPSQNNAWDAYIYPILHVEPRYASAYQQSEGAAILWRMGDEIQTWTLTDGCRV